MTGFVLTEMIDDMGIFRTNVAVSHLARPDDRTLAIEELRELRADVVDPRAPAVGLDLAARVGEAVLARDLDERGRPEDVVVADRLADRADPRLLARVGGDEPAEAPGDRRVGLEVAVDEAQVERVPCSSAGYAPDLVLRLTGTGTRRLLLLGHLAIFLNHSYDESLFTSRLAPAWDHVALLLLLIGALASLVYLRLLPEEDKR